MVYINERAKRAHSLFMSIEISDIYIYVRIVRVSCVPFSPYTKETPLRIIERAKRAHCQLIYIYSRSSRFMCTVYPVY